MFVYAVYLPESLIDAVCKFFYSYFYTYMYTHALRMTTRINFHGKKHFSFLILINLHVMRPIIKVSLQRDPYYDLKIKLGEFFSQF